MNGDKLIRGLLFGGELKLMAITGRELVEFAKQIHGLSRVATAALGRTLLITSMMGDQLKSEDDRVSAIVKGGGPLGNIVCTGKKHGIVKGYVENPTLELPLGPDGKLDVSMAVGWFGELVVVRDMGLKEPYTARCQMVSGEIAEDFANYFTVSEQQPTLLYLGVRLDAGTGDVRAAGGLLIQAMPDCRTESIDAVMAKVDDIKQISKRLEKAETIEDVLHSLFDDCELGLLEEQWPRFSCDCSGERLEKVLISLGIEELSDMKEKDHGAELKCSFCSKTYRFSEDDLGALITEASTKEHDRDAETH